METGVEGMAPLGKNISLYLMDGEAAGRWVARLSNWNCVAYKIPYGDLKEFVNGDEDYCLLSGPGVYFLFGKDDATGNDFVYVGEADNVLRRIDQDHTFQKNDTYWKEAITFVATDGSLDKARVKYLEHRFYTLAKEAERDVVKNSNTPTQSPLSKAVRDELEQFIRNAELILPVLGHRTLESMRLVTANMQAEDLLYFSRNGGKGGRGLCRMTEDGFWVLKGSYIYPNLSASAPNGIRKARKEYARIIDQNSILQENIRFSSPSYAASFVCGKSSNGLKEWKNKDGVSLKDLEQGKQEKPSSGIKPEREILHLSGHKAVARGYLDGKCFVVLKDSGICLNERKSCPASVHHHRELLRERGIVKNNVFAVDYSFSSPSMAASCIRGGTANGREAWLYEDGQSIKEREENS